MAPVVTFPTRPTCGMDRNTIKADQYVARLCSTISRVDARVIDQIAETLFEAYSAGRTIFTLGNGGSAALASHFACDLGKGVSLNAGVRRMRVLCLVDSIPLITAWANDLNYESIFAEQLRNFLVPGDVVFAISGSGNSPNVLRALELARSVGAITVGITGFQGGKMKPLCEVCLVIPSDNMQVIEDLHTVTAHAVSNILYNMVADSHRSNFVHHGTV